MQARIHALLTRTLLQSLLGIAREPLLVARILLLATFLALLLPALLTRTLLPLLLALLASLLRLLPLLLRLLALLRLLPLLALLLALLLLALLAAAHRLLLPLATLSLLLRHLLHLLAEFFSFPAKHLLLPARGRLLLIALCLFRQFLLTARQLFEASQHRFEFRVLLLLLASGGLRLASLVLVLLGIEFEIEQTFEVAARSATSRAATALLLLRHLDIAEHALRPQQGL